MANAGNVGITLTANASGWAAGFNAAMRVATQFSQSIGVLGVAIGTTLGNALTRALEKIATFISETMEMGRAARIAEAAFSAMARSVGQDADTIARKVAIAAGGLIDVTSAMSSLGRLLAEGFDTSQIEALATGAKNLSVLMGTDVTTAFNQMSQAVLAGNTRMLRTVGIYIDSQRAVEEYANALGKASGDLTEAGRAHAIMGAVLDALAKKNKALGDSMDPAIVKAQQLARQWDDLRQEIGKAADTVRTEFLGYVMNNWPKIQTMIKGTADVFLALTKTITGTFQAAQPILNLLLTTVNAVLAAFNQLPEEVRAMGVIGVLLFGRFGMTPLGKIGAVITIAAGLVTVIAEINRAHQESVPVQEKINALLKERTDLEAKLADAQKNLGDKQPNALVKSTMAGWQARLDAIKAQIQVLEDSKNRGMDALEDARAQRSKPTPVAGNKPPESFPDRDAMTQANRSVMDASHAYDIARGSLSDYRATIVDAIAILKPFAAGHRDIAERIQGLEKQLVDLDESAAKLHFEKVQHALSMAFDPSTIAGMEALQAVLVEMIQTASQAPQTEPMQAWIRSLDSQLVALQQNIANAHSAATANIRGVMAEVEGNMEQTWEEITQATFSRLDATTQKWQEAKLGPEEYEAELMKILASLEQLAGMGKLELVDRERLESLKNFMAEWRAQKGLTIGDDAQRLDRKAQKDVQEDLKNNEAVQLESLRRINDAREALIKSGTLSTKVAAEEELKLLRGRYQEELMLVMTTEDKALEAEVDFLEQYASLIEQRGSVHERKYAAMLRIEYAYARESGDIWRGLVAVIGQEIDRIPKFFDNAMQLARGIFQDLYQAWEDSFASLLKGDIDSFKDAWEDFVDSLINELARFLASATFRLFVEFLASLGNFGSGPGGSFSLPSVGGGGGGGSPAATAGGVALEAGKSAVSINPSTGVVSLAGYPIAKLGASAPPIFPGHGMPSFGGGSGASAASAMYQTGDTIVVDGSAIFAAEGGSAAAAVAGAEFTTPAAAAALTGAEGGASAAALGAGSSASGGAGSAAGGFLGAVAPYAPFVAIAAMIGMGVYDSIANKRPTRSLRQTANALTDFSELQGAFRMGDFGPTGVGLDTSLNALEFMEKNPGSVAKLLGIDKEQVPAVLADMRGDTSAAFRTATGLVLGGKTVEGLPHELVTRFGEPGDFASTDLRAKDLRDTTSILQQVPGFSGLGAGVQQNLAALGANFQGDRESVIELVKAVAELTSGLTLTNEQAAEFVDHGMAASEELRQSTEQTDALRQTLLDTTAGVGDAKQEAELFAQAIVSGQYPAEQLRGILAALAQEHGPEFLKVLEDILLQLGLSAEQVGEILKGFEKLGEGVTVPVRYETQGTPPPGADAPPPPPSTSDHASGGWVTSRYDTVEPDEFVMRRASAMAYPGLMESLNEDPHAAVAALVGSGDKETAKAALKELQAQTRILAEIRDGTRAARTPARVVGARQA